MTNGNGKPRVGIFGLTGCAGDQLQILNCEDELLRLAASITIVDWVMAKSDNDHTCRLDVAFVEGVVATELDLEILKTIRARTNFLVAIGTCAVWGGLPAMRNDLPPGILEREISRDAATFPGTVEALPATHFVRFDFLLPGCPIERHEFLAMVNSLLFGTVPELPAIPVCQECKTRENACRVISEPRGLLRRDDPRRLRRTVPFARRVVRRLPGARRGAALRRQRRHVRRPRNLGARDLRPHAELLGAGLAADRTRRSQKP